MWPKLPLNSADWFLLAQQKRLTPWRVRHLPAPYWVKAHLLTYYPKASAKALRGHACWEARRALTEVWSPACQAIQAIEVAELYCLGEVCDEELVRAHQAVRALKMPALAGDPEQRLIWLSSQASLRVLTHSPYWDALTACYGAITSVWGPGQEEGLDDLLERILTQ